MSNNAVISVQRWKRILPIVALMYTFAIIDRNNVSFALSGMEKTLGFGASVAGLAGGIFFVGYLFLQIPGGHVAEKYSAKKLIFWTLLIWGLIATSTGFVQNLWELLVLRFALGFVEGAVWPATLILLSKWFPLNERARANSYLVFSIPLASIIMSPLSGWIVQTYNWRYLFIIEGVFPWVMAFFWWFFIDDEPKKSKRLPFEEQNFIESALAEDREAVGQENVNYRIAFRNGNVWLLVLYNFLVQIGFYGFTLWLPTLVKTISHQDYIGVGLLTTLPWIAALIGLYINSKHSDQTGERKWHASIPVFLGGVFLFASILVGKNLAWIAMVFIILAMGFLYSYDGVFWTIPAALLPKETLGGGIGLINGVGNLGGFFGPFIVGYLIQTTKSFFAGVVFLMLCLVAAAIIILLVRIKQSYWVTEPSMGSSKK